MTAIPSRSFLHGSLGLRVYGAAPSLLERVVPDSTSKNGMFSDAFDLMGFALPPGTIVATQGWSMHRDASVFPFPDAFLPERWLDDGKNMEELTKMAQHMMPLGVGARVCGGQNLALIILRVVVSAIVRNFNIVAPAETTEKSMEMRDSFVRIISSHLENEWLTLLITMGASRSYFQLPWTAS